jgi:hypothetical protein
VRVGGLAKLGSGGAQNCSQQLSIILELRRASEKRLFG